MQKINVFIVDDHEFFRLGIRTAIHYNHPDIAIVGEAKCGADFFTLLETTDIDLVLLDIKLPDMSGMEIARRLKNEFPQIKILILSAETTLFNIEEMLTIGVEGFISKFDTNMNIFADAIRSVMQGLEFYGKDISHIISQIYLAKKKAAKITMEFSEQERRIIECCHQGFSGKQIAEQLDITYKTMEWHKSNIFKKLNIHSTVELVHFAVKNGIVGN